MEEHLLILAVLVQRLASEVRDIAEGSAEAWSIEKDLNTLIAEIRKSSEGSSG